MSGFGFKIVDRDPSEIAPILERAVDERRPVEVGLYFGDRNAQALIADRVTAGEIPLTVHLDHRRLSVFSLDKAADLLTEQLDLARALGGGSVVTHVAAYPMSPRPGHRKALLDRLYSRLRLLDDACEARGLDVFIENTFHDLNFYRRFFRGVIAGRFARVRTCFDIGHAKVWSSQSLLEWMDFLDGLDRDGLRLHFHLHANGGLSDEHLSFPTAESRGMTRPDGFTAGLDYYEAIAQLDQRFPSAIKIFEVPAEEALGNLEHVLHRLGGLEREREAAYG